jgi:isocitrate dehydrogenase (NAD+)
MKKSIVVAYIPGEGIGPEIVDSTIKVINKAIGKNIIQWKLFDLNPKDKNCLSDQNLKELKKFKFILKGPTETPVGFGHYSFNVQLRNKLGCTVSLRKFETLIPKLVYNINKYPRKIILISNGVDCIYSGMEFDLGNKKNSDVLNVIKKRFCDEINSHDIITLRLINPENVRKLCYFTKKYLIKNKIKKLTVVHKADIMKMTDGLFLKKTRKILKSNGNYSYDEMIGGPAHTRLIQDPSLFEVIVCPNFLRMTLSYTLAGLCGGFAFGPGCNYGDKNNIYESTHGAVLKYANKDIANPLSMILSGCIMLEDMGLSSESRRIKLAIKKTIERDFIATQDISRRFSDIKCVKQSEFVEAIISNL